METQNAIEINGLTKCYGKVTALDGVSFDVRQGELFGLIGPDGAGKTTLFRLLTTLLNPDNGTATVDGMDIVAEYKQIREVVGYMPGRFSLYPDLSVEENIAFFAALFGVRVEDNYDLIAPIYKQIEPFRTRRAGKLSGGMKQKLALCCALIHRPSVLFLDEPTTGVDAVSRSEFWDMLAELKKKGISMLVSTPYMDEASRCDRIALINEGHILGIDTPQGIVAGFDEPLYAVSSKEMFGLLIEARRTRGVKECYPFGEAHHMVTERGFDTARFADELTGLGFRNVVVRPVEAGIEDVFIKLMRHE
ncbi:MAG: ABC transporter ATP-binding protein [Alistipes sp.]|uniref:ABC transporter ATP-binding protein n=1 Tax=Alistipes intestinihominis TaxID=3133172 RepID=A0ABV1H0R3_9BACT|nr:MULTISPECIES: ABC transporter ATP-binding protein [Alistipes]MBR2218548.1 ABC transporter ATP-binding protein [Alistipes sp.]